MSNRRNPDSAAVTCKRSRFRVNLERCRPCFREEIYIEALEPHKTEFFSGTCPVHKLCDVATSFAVFCRWQRLHVINPVDEASRYIVSIGRVVDVASPPRIEAAQRPDRRSLTKDRRYQCSEMGSHPLYVRAVSGHIHPTHSRLISAY